MKRRREKQLQEELLRIEEERRKKDEYDRIVKESRARAAQSRLMGLQKDRAIRDQINRYSNKVVKEVMNNPKDIHYYRARQEKVEAVKKQIEVGRKKEAWGV